MLENVHHTRMRAGREDHEPLVPDRHRDEALVHDERIRLPAAAVDGLAMLTWQSDFKRRHPGNLTAQVDKAVEHRLRPGRMHDLRPMLLQLRSARNILEHAKGAVGSRHRARSVHVRVHVSRHVAAAIALPDHSERAQHRTAVVPVAVRQHEAFNPRDVEVQSLNVALEHRFIGPGIEQHRAGALAVPDGDRARQAMSGAAQATARQSTHAARPQA